MRLNGLIVFFFMIGLLLIGAPQKALADEGSSKGQSTFLQSLRVCLSKLRNKIGGPSLQHQEENPLLKPWEGEHGGLPPMGTIRESDFKPAFLQAIQDMEKGLQKLSQDKSATSFESVILPLEELDREFNRRLAPFFHFSANHSSTLIQDLDREFSPRLSELKSKLYQDPQLFEKVQALHKGDSKNGAVSTLSPEAQRLVEVYYKSFVENGAELPAPQKKRVAEIDMRLSTLFTEFSQNLLKDESEQRLVLDEAQGDLLGLPVDFAESLKNQAIEQGLPPGKAILPNTRSAIEPFLTFSKRRNLREQAFLMFQARGGNKNTATYNGPVVLEILKLRKEKAALFGYPHFVDMALSKNMVKKTEEIKELMTQVWTSVVKKAGPVLSELEKSLQEDAGGEAHLEPWDYRYYAERKQRTAFQFDSQALTAYLPLERVEKALFHSAHKLFGLKFEKIKASVPHPDVEVFSVIDSQNQFVGYWYFDLFARSGKRSGAWMSDLRSQDQLLGSWTYPIVTNNLNIIQGKPGSPILLSWDEVITLFHEFGHGLHGLTSRVNYTSLSGTRVPVDFVELPSQFFEAYALTDDAISFYADENGKPLPKEMLERMKTASQYNNVFYFIEFLSSMWVDHEIHKYEGELNDPMEFESQLLSQLERPHALPPRHPVLGFSHLFSGDHYAGNYSAYLVSQVLSDDANEAFEEKGDMYDPVLAEKIFNEIYTSGNTLDVAERFYRFRGRGLSTKAFLKKNGL